MKRNIGDSHQLISIRRSKQNTSCFYQEPRGIQGRHGVWAIQTIRRMLCCNTVQIFGSLKSTIIDVESWDIRKFRNGIVQLEAWVSGQWVNVAVENVASHTLRIETSTIRIQWTLNFIILKKCRFRFFSHPGWLTLPQELNGKKNIEVAKDGIPSYDLSLGFIKSSTDHPSSPPTIPMMWGFLKLVLLRWDWVYHFLY